MIGVLRCVFVGRRTTADVCEAKQIAKLRAGTAASQLQEFGPLRHRNKQLNPRRSSRRQRSTQSPMMLPGKALLGLRGSVGRPARKHGRQIGDLVGSAARSLRCGISRKSVQSALQLIIAADLRPIQDPKTIAALAGQANSWPVIIPARAAGRPPPLKTSPLSHCHADLAALVRADTEDCSRDAWAESRLMEMHELATVGLVTGRTLKGRREWANAVSRPLLGLEGRLLACESLYGVVSICKG